MAINYVKLQSRAKKLIGPNGTRCVLLNPSGKPPVYNPQTNEYDTSDERFDGFCIVSGYEDKLVDGTVIKVGDRKVMAVLDGEPKPGLSKLEVYDKTGKILKEKFNVVNPTKVSPDATTVILYRLQCRK
jgi:hypothetical protein